MEYYRIPQGRILVKEILPEHNGIILTDRPEYKRGQVVIGSTEIEVGEYVAFKANGDVIKLDGEEYRLIKESVCVFRGKSILNADIKDAFNNPSETRMKTC